MHAIIFLISDLQPPAAPPGLIHTFLILASNITAKLMWHEPVSGAPITSYRLVWGRQAKGGEGMDAETALTKVLGEVRISGGFDIKFHRFFPMRLCLTRFSLGL